MTEPPTAATRLAHAVREKHSIVCLGLDPRRESLPPAIAGTIDSDRPDVVAAAYTLFCKEILDVAAEKVACVKPQSAFFEALGPAGVVALGEVIAYAKNLGVEVIVDAKRNDIGSTATAYAQAYLGSASPFGGDWLTVSPYLGRDSIEPFVDACDRQSAGIFVLVKTSNPSGGMIQDRITDSTPVYRCVADALCQWNADRLNGLGYGPIGAVVGATYPDQLAELRSALPNAWILIPGFGAQGGGVDDVRPGVARDGLGAVVNSSRHLIFAHDRQPYREKYSAGQWQHAVADATDEMNSQLSTLLPPAP
ncbi:MAG: orotidine-5'-phosphate decarboxylase [Planctomycetota bacterium]